MKKLISTICAAAMALSAFSGLYARAESAEVYETIFEDNFDNGIDSVTDEGAVPGRQISVVDDALKFGDSYETFHINFNGNKAYSSSIKNTFKLTFDAKVANLSRLGIGLGDKVRNNGAYWSFSMITPNGKPSTAVTGNLSMGSAWEDENKLYALKNSSGAMKAAEENKWYSVEAYLEMPSTRMTTKAWLRSDPSVIYTNTITAPAPADFKVGGSKGTEISAVRLFSRGVSYIDNVKVERLVPQFKATGASFNGAGIDITFSAAASDVSGITLNGQSVSGTLSGDGLTYTLPASNLKTGTYTVVVPAGIQSVGGGSTEEDAVFVLDIKDQDTMGYHPFTGGQDNGKALNTGGVGSNHASIEQDTDGNYYLKATKGKAAASGDPGDYRCWQYLNPNSDGIGTYWNEQSAYKFMSIEFDIRTKAAMTNKDRIYFSQKHKYQNGLQIFGMDSETVAMGEPEADRAFKEITALTPGQWYHYTYILDVNNKKAKAVLSDGTNEYKVDWKDLAGSGQGYWKDNLPTPFTVMAFQLAGGEINLDNITFKKYYPAPTVNADSIVIKSGDEVQSDWGEVSALTNKIEIDFSAPMNEATVNSDSVYVTAKGSTEKISAAGAFVSGKYVLTLDDALTGNTEYELHITTAVQNVKGETFAAEDYTAGFKTATGELNVKLNSVKASDGASVDTLDALKLLGGQKVKINIDYTNTLQKEGEYNIIVAHFDSDGLRLAAAEIINVKHDAAVSGVNEDIEYTVPADMDSITATKIFCWREFEKMTSLSSPIELK